MRDSLFQQLGGFAKVRLVVSDFYERALESDTLAAYFEGVDMRNLVDHQTKFISSLMGGPVSFTDDHLRRVHARFRISDRDFDEMGQVLLETLEDNGLPDPAIRSIMAQVEQARSAITSPVLEQSA